MKQAERKCLVYSSTLKMEATYSSETSVDFQRTSRNYIPEISTLLLNFFQIKYWELQSRSDVQNLWTAFSIYFWILPSLTFLLIHKIMLILQYDFLLPSKSFQFNYYLLSHSQYSTGCLFFIMYLACKIIVEYRSVAKRWFCKQRPSLCSARSIRVCGDIMQQ
jgi:hypothetical protein